MTPILHTERLKIYPVTDDHLPHLVAGLNYWSVARNLSPIPFPYAIEDALSYFPAQQRRRMETDSHCWIIFDAGFCGLVAVDFEGRIGELGYWLRPDCWGKGYATEAARAAVGFAFAGPRCDKLVAGHAEDNPASGRVLTKLGFVEIKRGEHYYVSRQMMVSRIGLELTRERWQAFRS